jgi:uncharacterized protein with PQ loop repeat
MEKTWTEEILGWTAFGFNSYFILYPIFAFSDVVKGKLKYEDSPYNYAAVNYINCLCWLCYSDLLYSDQIKVINLIGTVINGIFLLIYLSYEVKKYLIDAILNGLILASGTYMIYLSLTVMIEDDVIIGRICSTSYCLLFYFPIELIYRVIKQKNFMLIPFCSAWGSMFMSIFWILYGIIITEIYLVIPHCINVIFEIQSSGEKHNFNIRQDIKFNDLVEMFKNKIELSPFEKPEFMLNGVYLIDYDKSIKEYNITDKSKINVFI